MGKIKIKNGHHVFEIFSSKAMAFTGSTYGFTGALIVIVLWGICGPIFHYSDKWQVIINTGTTIVTFLMVFLIQKSQNKDSLAIQLKLNELVASHEFASNRLVNIEDMTEDELRVIQKYYSNLSARTKDEESLQQSHSIEETLEQFELKEEIKEEIKQEAK